AGGEELSGLEVAPPAQRPALTGYGPSIPDHCFVRLRRPRRFGSEVQKGGPEIFCFQFNGAEMFATDERAVDEVAQRFGVELDGAFRLLRHLQRRSETPLRRQKQPRADVQFVYRGAFRVKQARVPIDEAQIGVA